MLARLELHPGRVRMLLHHRRKDRLLTARRETMRLLSESISIAETGTDVSPWWIDGTRCWVYRAWLIGDPHDALPHALADELRTRGFRVVVAKAGPTRILGT